jgi:hypothetical protein
MLSNIPKPSTIQTKTNTATVTVSTCFHLPDSVILVSWFSILMETENKTNFYSKKSLKMEVIIQKTGWLLYLLNRKGKELLSTRVLRNHTSVILFIMLVCFITFLITFWAWGYPVLKIIIYTSTTLMMLFVALIFVGSWHEA